MEYLVIYYEKGHPRVDKTLVITADTRPGAYAVAYDHFTRKGKPVHTNDSTLKSAGFTSGEIETIRGLGVPNRHFVNAITIERVEAHTVKPEGSVKKKA